MTGNCESKNGNIYSFEFNGLELIIRKWNPFTTIYEISVSKILNTDHYLPFYLQKQIKSIYYELSNDLNYLENLNKNIQKINFQKIYNKES